MEELIEALRNMNEVLGNINGMILNVANVLALQKMHMDRIEEKVDKLTKLTQKRDKVNK